MCGIVGYVGTRPPSAPLEAMRDSMRHRGPDGAGSWHSPDHTVWFGHRRLAIIDLSPGGAQPMVAPGGHVAITFNGEIYNYRELREVLRGRGWAFRTQSDTEVILAAYRQWGVDFLRHLRGMFALALWDDATGLLLAGRDRAGEKPLYFRSAPDGLWFASELQALLAIPGLPRRTSLDRIEHYLAFGYPPPGESMIEGVQRLPAGYLLVYDRARQTVETRAYWTPPPPPGSSPHSLEPLATELEDLLEQAVGEQLHADVPVGVLLSGGLDSSLVTAVGAKVAPGQLRTFTVTFPDDPEFDEAEYARLVAEHCGTRHSELHVPEPDRDLPEFLGTRLGEPLADSSLIPTYLVSRVIRDHAAVAVGGDGGDELFGGYHHHNLVQRYDRVHRFVPVGLAGQLSAWAEGLLPLTMPGRGTVIQALGGVPGKLGYGPLMGPALRRRVAPGLDRGLRRPGPEAVRLAMRRPEWSALQQVTRLDFATYMVDDVLAKVDRASMLTSLEVRAPFLDHRVIEFAFGSVPDSAKIAAGRRKVLLRVLASRLLPPTLDTRRKQGFSIPLHRWLRGPWRTPLRETLLSASLGEWIAPAAAEWLLRRLDRGHRVEHQLYALWMLGLWKDRFGVSA